MDLNQFLAAAAGGIASVQTGYIRDTLGTASNSLSTTSNKLRTAWSTPISSVNPAKTVVLVCGGISRRGAFADFTRQVSVTSGENTLYNIQSFLGSTNLYLGIDQETWEYATDSNNYDGNSGFPFTIQARWWVVEFS